MKNYNPKFKNKFYVFILGGLLTAGFFVWQFGSQNFEISKNTASNLSGADKNESILNKNGEKSIISGSLSGLDCENKNRRPVAVMLAGDPHTRPLSGIGEADIVVEMPVITGDINRFMAVYQCDVPKEIGSARSSRHDFIPLATAFDAIFVHWGGSHFALEKLDKGIIDNIDALKNNFGAFWRKEGISAPDNGFTSASRLSQAIQKFGYRQESEFEGYWRTADKAASEKKGVLEIGYPGVYAVRYEYFPNSNAYLRFKNGKPEIDKNNNTQVRVKNIVVMIAEMRQIEGQYNDVDVEGDGRVVVYKNGEEIKGKWKKDAKNIANKLYFYDKDGNEILLAPGSIWIEIVSPETEVFWKIFD